MTHRAGMGLLRAMLAAWALGTTGCARGVVGSPDAATQMQPSGASEGDAALSDAGSMPPKDSSTQQPASDATTQAPPDAGLDPQLPPPPECDLTGKWAVAQFTDSIADVLGVPARQRALNYLYFEIEQHGTKFMVRDSLRCGFRVTGATTVTVSDATLNALLGRDNSNGRRGTYGPNAAGGCDFTLEESVNVMGCTTPYYRLNRNEPLPTTPASGTTPGTEDWEQDSYDGITLNSGGGPRYVAMRDWNAYSGATPQNVSDRFQVSVSWDSQESVLEPTNLILRAPSRRDDAGDHHAVWKRVDDSLPIPGATGLETCKNVQSLLADAK